MKRRTPTPATPKEAKDIMLPRNSNEIKSSKEKNDDRSHSFSSPYDKISPADFANFVPFLALELLLHFTIVVNKTEMGKYSNKRLRVNTARAMSTLHLA